MSLYRSRLARLARHRWPRVKRVLPWAVLALALVLLGYFGSAVDWPGVWQAVRRIPRDTILLAAALVLPAYLPTPRWTCWAGAIPAIPCPDPRCWAWPC
ncbi:hypothetical protein WJ972_13625 [Achromobacter insuavis]